MGLLASTALPALGEFLRLLPAHIYSVVLSLELAAAVGAMLGEASAWLGCYCSAGGGGIGISILTLVRRRRRRRTARWRMRTITCRVRWMHAVDIAQMATNSITIPSAEQIKADREAKGPLITEL